MGRVRVIDIIWVEDIKAYLPSIKDELNELEREFKVKLEITEKNNSIELDRIAHNIPSALVFCIDYNLTNEDGIGIDGDQVIRRIRDVNPTCLIVFYSAKLNQEELRSLIGNDDHFTNCVYRPNLLAKLKEMLENGDL
jgi:CheY-like chemotaxis protein